jgi:hypothetical protein
MRKSVRLLAVWIVLPAALTGCTGCPGGTWQRIASGGAETVTFREIGRSYERTRSGPEGQETVTGSYVTRPSLLGLWNNEMDITTVDDGVSVTEYCIYKIEGNTLYLAGGDPRPADFTKGLIYNRVSFKELESGGQNGMGSAADEASGLPQEKGGSEP